MWVGDPCYTSSGRNPAEEWGEFVSKLEDQITLIDHESGHPGKAVVIGGFGGDGAYPVYVKRNKHGRIKAMKVVFDDRRDTDGEEQ